MAPLLSRASTHWTSTSCTAHAETARATLASASST
ncbi:hypothetical protein L914_02905 [Phytophthora nicotianae]|uniref:Uncharacterized protein n=1 Tax=Phytophthora nicotianae TaxID=4792 RepID=W2P143_PHYNI|nr:hypothetical protein L914_02905 [Phytophthora nicotianae]